MQTILIANRITCAVLSLIIYAVPCCRGAADSSKLCILSVAEKTLALESGEKVDGFQLNLQEACVQSMEKIPNHWTVKISNEQNAVTRFKTPGNLPYWTTQIEAHALSKEALLRPSFFQKFVVIEKDKEHAAIFDAELTVFLSNRIRKTHRRALIPMYQLLMTQVNDQFTYAAPGKFYVENKNTVPLSKNKRIAGFTFKLEKGSIESFAEIPIGWQVNIANNLDGTAVVDGKYGLGASRVGSEFTRELNVGVRESNARTSGRFQAKLTLDLEDRTVAIPVSRITEPRGTRRML